MEAPSHPETLVGADRSFFTTTGISTISNHCGRSASRAAISPSGDIGELRRLLHFQARDSAAS